MIADISQEERIVNICLSRNGLIPIATIDLLDECRSLNLIRSRFDTLIRSGFKSVKSSIDLTYFAHMSPTNMDGSNLSICSQLILFYVLNCIVSLIHILVRLGPEPTVLEFSRILRAALVCLDKHVGLIAYRR